MLSAFALTNNRLRKVQPLENLPGVDSPVWIDVVAATNAERDWVEQHYKLTLPRPEHLRDIEASARFYEEDGVLHLCSDFLLGQHSNSRSVTVAFVLSGAVLLHP